MAGNIQQSVTLPATAQQLYEMYLDSEAHGAFTGHPVTIGDQPGDEFRAFDGMLTGHTIATIPGRLIVQAWRSAHFHEDDPDSTLVLSFTDQGDQARIDLVHVNVPDHDYDGVTEGWPMHYWEPWRKHLES